MPAWLALLCAAGRALALSLGRMWRKWGLAYPSWFFLPLSTDHLPPPAETHQPSAPSLSSLMGSLWQFSFHHREGNWYSWTVKVGLWQTEKKLSSHIPAKRRWWQPQQSPRNGLAPAKPWFEETQICQICLLGLSSLTRTSSGGKIPSRSWADEATITSVYIFFLVVAVVRCI